LSFTIRAIIAKDSREGQNIAQLWLEVALCERNFDAASRALAALAMAGCYDGFIPFPRFWCQGVVAQMKGDKAAAHAAFITARNEAAKLITDQPDYAEALCVLGMVDAALGNKEDAIREGRRAAELVPVSKNAIERRVTHQIPGCYLCVDGREGSCLRTVNRRGEASRFPKLR